MAKTTTSSPGNGTNGSHARVALAAEMVGETNRDESNAEEPSGEYIETHTNRHMYPFDPSADMVCLEDIAHAVAHLCRFTGHTNRFYSVAEHSVHVSLRVPKKFAKAALLHDAAEAYMHDIPRPLKRFLYVSLDGDEGLPYKVFEARLLDVIFGVFGLKSWTAPTSSEMRDAVHEADNRMLAREYIELINPELPRGLAHVVPYDHNIGCLSPVEAKAAFLDRAKALGIQD